MRTAWMQACLFLMGLSLWVGALGCSAVPGVSPSLGWNLSVGTPAVVQVPVVATQGAAPVTMTTVGTHAYMPSEVAADVRKVDVQTVPQPNPTRTAKKLPPAGPCDE